MAQSECNIGVGKGISLFVLCLDRDCVAKHCTLIETQISPVKKDPAIVSL